MTPRVVFIPLLFMAVVANGQEKITVNGQVFSSRHGAALPSAIVVVKGENRGTFADVSGKFTRTMAKNDTLIISARGYAKQTFTFADLSDANATIEIYLREVEYELNQVVVIPQRQLSEVHEDLSTMERDLPDRTSGLDAISSPISAIYARLSKKERSKMLVAQMEYEDHRRELLKELFALYVDADIIALSPDEFEQFIRYCNITDSFLRNAKEYQLIEFFKRKYQQYALGLNDE